MNKQETINKIIDNLFDNEIKTEMNYLSTQLLIDLLKVQHKDIDLLKQLETISKNINSYDFEIRLVIDNGRYEEIADYFDEVIANYKNIDNKLLKGIMVNKELLVKDGKQVLANAFFTDTIKIDLDFDFKNEDLNVNILDGATYFELKNFHKIDFYLLDLFNTIKQKMNSTQYILLQDSLELKETTTRKMKI